MYSRSPSPYQVPLSESQYHGRPYSPAPGASSIVPGSITYTTSTGLDGRTIYHPFRAVSAQYQTQSGVVSGIQWVPAEATQILPPGAQQATSEFLASWNRGYNTVENVPSNWGNDEEKRRRKEEKEAKRMRELVDYDADLRKARERDAQANMARERRKSLSTSTPGVPVPYSFSSVGSTGYPGPGYPPSHYSGYNDRPGSVAGGAPGYPATSNISTYPRERDYSYSDVDRQFKDLDLDRRDRDRNRDRDYPGERERKLSRPTKYSEPGDERPRDVTGSLGPRPGSYDAGGYGPASGPYNSSMRSYSAGPGPPNTRASPKPQPGEMPYVPPGPNYSSSLARVPSEGLPRATTPFGSGAPPGVYPRSRPSSPMPIPSIPGVTGPPRPHSSGPISFPQASPRMPHAPPIPGETARTQQLAAPEGFSRPVNAGNSFPPFDVIKVQDMEKFWTDVPRMPPILVPHDVLEADWIRLMQDVALAWAGKLPVLDHSRSSQPPRRSILVAELVDLWNNSFFFVRGIELVLYKGRERRSGTHVGTIDKDLPYLDEPDDYISSSESEETDDSGSDYGSGRYSNVYGQTNTQQPLAGVFEAGRQRRDAKIAAKAERRRKRRERNRRRRERYRDRKYSLYLTYVRSGVAGGGHMNTGVPYPTPGSSYSMPVRGGIPGGYNTAGGY